MNAIELPSLCSCHSLIELLGNSDVFTSDWDKLPLIVPDDCHVTTDAMAFLCAWGLLLKQTSRRITAVGRSSATQYLSRMNLFRHLEFDYTEEFQRHDETGRFIPLTLVETDQDVKKVVDAISDLLLHQFEDARKFLPALEWSTYEIIDNILIHSDTPVPGVVCAQYFPEPHRINVGICDMGKGIKKTLEESYDLFSHGDAITKALQRGVTRNQKVGQGNGLAGSVEIARANGGNFKLWTGDCMYDLRGGEDGKFRVFSCELPGTGVNLRLNTELPVDLKSTFIGDSGWNYMNIECERIEQQGGLKVADECIHTGGREPARRLRYKIINLLPDFDGPLPLDFTGIETASSSFFDELLGRLALRLGADKFRKQIRIQNLLPELESMANVVIHQRVQPS